MKNVLKIIRDAGPYVIGIVVLVGYLNDFHGFYGNYLEQKRAEDGLVLMNTGVSVKHVVSVFGSPMVENHDGNKGLSEYVYSFKNFYLQVVFDKENTVKFFSVTSKSEKFQPRIPYLDGSLGFTFFELSDSYSENKANFSSKLFEYNENIYLGNRGNHRNVYLAYNPAGTDYGRIQMLPYEEMPNPSREVSNQFRKVSYPNTYGVGSILGGREDGETEFGVGVEYFVSRDLPEHQY